MTTAIYANEILNDEQLDKIAGGGVPIISIITTLAPIVLPPLIDRVNKNIDNPTTTPAVPNRDLNKFKNPTTTELPVPLNPGDAVPNRDLNKFRKVA